MFKWPSQCFPRETHDPDKLYANVGPDGLIVFEKHADPGLGRLPVAIGNPAAVMQVIKQWAALHPDGVTYYLPKVALAKNQIEAVDELSAYRAFFAKQLRDKADA